MAEHPTAPDDAVQPMTTNADNGVGTSAVTPTAAVQAAARARKQATVVAAVGAAVPTVLAAQGMASLATDVLGFPLPAAVALASFLELALVSSALLARAAALAGRPGGADAVAVWVVSATSGLLAGVHELTHTAGDGTTTWSADPGSVLAAAVRVVAPLVAAWLWERVLQAARAEQAERTLAEVRRDRRYLEVARAALLVRRMEQAGHASNRRIRRARRRMDRAHVAALRAAPPAPTLADVLEAVGQVDHLPAATSVAPLTSPSAPTDVIEPVAEEHVTVTDAKPEYVVTVAAKTDDRGAPAPAADARGTVHARSSADRPEPAEPVVRAAREVEKNSTTAVTIPQGTPTAPAGASPALQTVVARAPRRASVGASEGGPADAGVDWTTGVAKALLEIFIANPEVTNDQVAEELTARGHTVSSRTARRRIDSVGGRVALLERAARGVTDVVSASAAPSESEDEGGLGAVEEPEQPQAQPEPSATEEESTTEESAVEQPVEDVSDVEDTARTEDDDLSTIADPDVDPSGEAPTPEPAHDERSVATREPVTV